MATTIIKARLLIDGERKEAIDDPVVVVEDQRISGVFQGAIPADRPVDPAASLISLPEATLLPGLIDCHVHLNLPGDGTPFPITIEEPDGVLVAISVRNAHTALHAGITTLRDCGGRGATTFEVRRAIEKGYAVGPRLILCGQPITITGGHCWYFGGEADGPDELRHKVRSLAKMGADFIKVMGTGGGTPGTLSWQPSYSREELQVLAREAHSLQRRLSIHCLCGEAILLAAEIGADHIEHAWFISDEGGNQRYMPEATEALARSGARVSATLSVGYHAIKTLSAIEKRSASDQANLDRWRIMLEQNLSHFRAQVQGGVQFVAGTDAGWAYTPYTAVIDEMELMREGGLSPMESIVAATSRAAAALAIDDRVGVVREGYAANLLAVRGNPLQNLRHLEQPQLVMKDGLVVRAAL